MWSFELKFHFSTYMKTSIHHNYRPHFSKGNNSVSVSVRGHNVVMVMILDDTDIIYKENLLQAKLPPSGDNKNRSTLHLLHNVTQNYGLTVSPYTDVCLLYPLNDLHFHIFFQPNY